MGQNSGIWAILVKKGIFDPKIFGEKFIFRALRKSKLKNSSSRVNISRRLKNRIFVFKIRPFYGIFGEIYFKKGPILGQKWPKI